MASRPVRSLCFVAQRIASSFIVCIRCSNSHIQATSFFRAVFQRANIWYSNLQSRKSARKKNEVSIQETKSALSCLFFDDILQIYSLVTMSFKEHVMLFVNAATISAQTFKLFLSHKAQQGKLEPYFSFVRPTTNLLQRL